MVVERREERYAEPSIRHGVQQTVAGGGEEKVRPDRQSADIRQPVSKSHEHNGTRERRGENKGVGEPSVSPKVTVSDAKPKSDHIDVRDHRAQCAYDPDTFRNAGLVKERADSKGGYSV